MKKDSRNKLSDQQKIDMVEKYKTGLYTCTKLGIEFGVDKSNVCGILKRRGIKINNNRSELSRKYKINDYYFDDINTEEKAYFLGLLYADGYNGQINNSIIISLMEEDKEILEKFKNAVSSNKELDFISYKDKYPTWKNQYRLSMNNKHMSQQLAKLGCVQKKSLILRFPTEQQVPIALLKHFIRGYYDGDGSMSFGFNGKKKQFRAQCSVVSTIDFCLSLQEYIEKELNIKFAISKQPSSGNIITRSLRTSGHVKTPKFLDWLYQESTIYLDRKYKKYQLYKESLKDRK